MKAIIPAPQKTITVNGEDYTIQALKPSLHVKKITELADDPSARMDWIFKNTVISPRELRDKGVVYFDERWDEKSMLALNKEIDTFQSNLTPISETVILPKGE